MTGVDQCCVVPVFLVGTFPVAVRLRHEGALIFMFNAVFFLSPQASILHPFDLLATRMITEPGPEVRSLLGSAKPVTYGWT